MLVVTFQAQALEQAYVCETGLKWPLLVDSERSLYHAYDMYRGHWWNIFGPASWAIYAKLLLQGRKLRAPTGDTQQLGGDVLIDPQGIVRLHHVGNGPADRPAVATLLDIVRKEN